MKKLLVLTAAIAVCVVAIAASFKWSAANIYGPDQTTKLSGVEVSLYCDALSDTALSTVTTSSAGAVAATTFEVANAVGDTVYDFYFKAITTYEGKEYQLVASKSATALETGTATIAFGNMATTTQAAGAWTAVPEPTSGLLMLLGMAGLALKRKRA